MLEVLKFIFSNFWIWLGTLILVSAIAEGIGGVIRSFVRRNKTQANKVGVSDRNMKLTAE